jgi:hypothetical protein
MSNFFELKVFHGGTKWNPNYRQYVETSAKQATEHSAHRLRHRRDARVPPPRWHSSICARSSPP